MPALPGRMGSPAVAPRCCERTRAVLPGPITASTVPRRPLAQRKRPSNDVMMDLSTHPRRSENLAVRPAIVAPAPSPSSPQRAPAPLP
eukprot:1059449-Amphidinium_carterae.2